MIFKNLAYIRRSRHKENDLNEDNDNFNYFRIKYKIQIILKNVEIVKIGKNVIQ